MTNERLKTCDQSFQSWPLRILEFVRNFDFKNNQLTVCMLAYDTKLLSIESKVLSVLHITAGTAPVINFLCNLQLTLSFPL